MDSSKSNDYFHMLFAIGKHSKRYRQHYAGFATGKAFGMKWRLWTSALGDNRMVIYEKKAKGEGWSEYSTVEAIEQWVAEHK